MAWFTGFVVIYTLAEAVSIVWANPAIPFLFLLIDALLFSVALSTKKPGIGLDTLAQIPFFLLMRQYLNETELAEKKKEEKENSKTNQFLQIQISNLASLLPKVAQLLRRYIEIRLKVTTK